MWRLKTQETGLVTPSANNKLHTPSPSQGENQAMTEREVRKTDTLCLESLEPGRISNC